MWETYADLFKGKKVSTLFFESVFLFLVFILTSDRTTAIWGPFGNGLVCKGKFIMEQCFVNPSPAPRHLTKTKSHKEHPFFQKFYNVHLFRALSTHPDHSDHIKG